MKWLYNPIVLLAYLFVLSGAAYTPEVRLSTHDVLPSAMQYFDDSPTILSLKNDKLWISHDDGKLFEEVSATKDQHVVSFQIDPFLKDRAFVLTNTKTHFYTENQGKSWKKFDAPIYELKENGMASVPSIEFNAADSNLLIISNYQCPDSGKYSHRCEHKYHYTTDGFRSVSKELPIKAHVCRFARSNPKSQIAKVSSIYCAVNELNSYKHIVRSTLIRSDNFGKDQNVVDLNESGSGAIIDIKVEESFLTVVQKLDKFSENSKIDMYVSRDGESFFKADLQVDIKYGVMSFLDSSPSSFFVQTTDYSSKMSDVAKLFRSDSSGVHYKLLLDNIAEGIVMKVENIDGAWLANTAVDKESDSDDLNSFLDFLLGGGFAKDIVTKFSFDDGDTWQLLKLNNEKCKLADGCSVHLWSFSEYSGKGKFVTGPTPGILMGIGSEGKHLGKYEEMNTYVSRDGGASWDFAIDTPCVFSFGDQGNIIMAVPYHGVKQESPANYFYFSLDQGLSWEKVELEEGIFVLDILTTLDGTSRKFLIEGVKPEEGKQGYTRAKEVQYFVDFANVHDGKVCSDSDFEEWTARKIDEDSSPTCVYGHREKFRRRKADAKCSVDKLFEDIKVIDDPCECTEADFECSIGFMPSEKGDGQKCVPDPTAIKALCGSSKSSVLEIYDKTLVQEDKCNMGGKKIDDFATMEKFKCSEYNKPGDDNSGEVSKIVVKLNEIEGRLSQYAYVGTDDDKLADNVVLKTSEDRAYISNDGGISFVKVPVHDRILGFFTGPVSGQVVLLTDSEYMYVSQDGGALFERRKIPAELSSQISRPIAFHKTDADKFIWIGSDCSKGNCEPVAYYTTNGGQSFKELMTGAITCDYVGSVFEQPEENLVYCTEVEDNNLRSLWSINGQKNPEKLFDNIVGYAVTGHYVVVAVVQDKSLEAKVTVDGKTFADADFPNDLKVEAHQAYTVLDSTSGSIFMHVTTSSKRDFEYGTLLKSNSNGTYFVTSLPNVNRNDVGFVDFDKIEGLEGLIIANIVANYKEDKAPKKLQTQVSRNDGSEWGYFIPPPTDSKGVKYKCNGSRLSKCALHLHGFTERADYRDTYSSGSATGFLIGVGNVGEYLTDYNEAATFLSIDGGVTWKEVQEGVYHWEFGDQGTILALVSANDDTDSIIYSLDEGKTWSEYKFSDKKVKVLDLATVPTDTSRKFLIFAVDPKDSRETLSFSIDFTNIYARQCQLDLDHPDLDDYEYWSPIHPEGQDKCLFGHEAKYLRRLSNKNDCFIGSAPLSEAYKQIRVCPCTRRDYECDYNYVRDPLDNTCKLVPGMSAGDRKKSMCEKPDAFQYFDSTGYRKIPLSTCVGGKQFDKWEPKACPGKQKEFNEYYGRDVKGGKLFILLFVPIVVFVFATWFVYDRGIKRNGGFQRLGQIRLDEGDFSDGFHPIEDNKIDVVVNRIVKGGVVVAAGVVATLKTVKKIDSLLLNKIGDVVFRRNTGRRNYVNIPEEDDELFGDYEDGDEDVDEELQDGARYSSQYHRDVDHDLENFSDNNKKKKNNYDDDDDGDDHEIFRHKYSDFDDAEDLGADHLVIGNSTRTTSNERLFDIDDADDVDDEDEDLDKKKNANDEEAQE